MSNERITVALNMTNVISLITIAGSCAWFVAAQAKQIEQNTISIERIDTRLHINESLSGKMANDILWIRQHIEKEHSSPK